MTRKPYTDPFPNLPRRFGSFREIEATAPAIEKQAAPTKRAVKKAKPAKPKPRSKRK